MEFDEMSFNEISRSHYKEGSKGLMYMWLSAEPNFLSSAIK